LIVRWTPHALFDLERLHGFLVDKSPRAAANARHSLTRAPDRLKDFPRIGPRLEQFEGREVRRIVVGEYEIRYEIIDETVWILQLWHGREDR
jgi:plasmid stabilization system protein ParE